MKEMIYILLFINLPLFAQQNLVPNPSFEIYDTCPTNVSQLYLLENWYQPTAGTSDFYHACSEPGGITGVNQNFFGSQVPLSGMGYAGLLVQFEQESDTLFTVTAREYIQAELTQPMISGQMYFISFNVSLGDASIYGTDDIGLFLSNDSIVNHSYQGNLNVNPQIENTQGNFLFDPTVWYYISGEYTALGGERFVTIGNFKSTANTTLQYIYPGSPPSGDRISYYFIDDVCISTSSEDCLNTTGIKNSSTPVKKLIRVLDTMGRETENKSNTLLIYLYSDGTTEKVFRFE